jgi:hypothetical protein
MNDVKKCPFCGEEILAAAKKCKHCGKWIEEIDNYPNSQEQQEPLKQQSSDNHEIISNCAGNKQKKSVRLSKNKLLLGIAIGIACTCLIGALFYIIKPKQEQLYLMESMLPNSDNSYYVGVVTTDFRDCLVMEADEDGGWFGDFQIVIHKWDLEKQYSQLKSILKSSQIGSVSSTTIIDSRNLFLIGKKISIYKIYPSSKYPTVVYFNGITAYDYYNGGGGDTFYGKVDIKTLKYDIFKGGEVFGMISYGSYKNCYLAQRGDLLYIYPQSPIGESYDPIITFDPKKYFVNADLWDSSVRKSIINWVENQ